MKKQLLVGMLALGSVFCAFGGDLTVKNVGDRWIDQVYVGAQQPFVKGWPEGAVSLAPGESKTLQIIGKQPILAIGRYGQSQYYIEEGESNITKKPMLAFISYGSDSERNLVKAVDIDDNGNATIEIEASRIKDID